MTPEWDYDYENTVSLLIVILIVSLPANPVATIVHSQRSRAVDLPLLRHGARLVALMQSISAWPSALT